MNVDDETVRAARAAYAAARPESARWAARAAGPLPGGNTRSVLHFEPFPFRVERAEGKYLWDVDGHRYLDLLGNYTAGLLGHSPPTVLAAAREALGSGWALGATHPDEVRLAELVVSRFPGIEQVRFTNSGTEANLMALATATHHTGRRTIIVFEHGYHGGVLTFAERPAPVTVPHDWLVLPYNDGAAVEAAFDRRGPEIAAVLVEPLQGSAGCIPGDPQFLTGLRRCCDRYGALLVFDEVMTSRLAAGGAQQRFGILPDLTTLGKYLAGGLTFGAFGGSRAVMAHFDGPAGGALGHAGTFNNNVASMAAGVAALDGALTDAALESVNSRGDVLRCALDAVFDGAGLDMSVTGLGSLMNVHGTRGPVRSAADLAAGDDRRLELFFLAALDAGYYLARRGFVALSLEITDADVDGFLDWAASWAATTTRSATSGAWHQM